MSSEQTVNSDLGMSEIPLRSRLRRDKPAKYALYAVIGAGVAVAVPALLALMGVGMSRQNESVAANTASGCPAGTPRQLSDHSPVAQFSAVAQLWVCCAGIGEHLSSRGQRIEVLQV